MEGRTFKGGKHRLKKKLFPWLLMAPALSLLLFIIGIPIAGTAILSLTNWDGFSTADFIGIQNYLELISDQVFWYSLMNNFTWMAVFLTVPVLLGISVSLWIRGINKGKLFYRVTSFLPYVLSTVVTAKLWALIYNPFDGINAKLEEWGLDFLALSWLGDVDIALFSVAFADLWHFWGFLVVLFLGGMQQLDPSFEEAAKVEGANKFQILWHVILPQLRPTIVLVYMLLVIWSFAAFDYVFVMTNGGPGNATELLSTYMYDLAIYSQRPGYASAVAITMGVFALLVIGGFGYLRKKGWDV